MTATPASTAGSESDAYATTKDYDAIELPYKGNAIAMDIVMPKTAFATSRLPISVERVFRFTVSS